MSKKDAKRPVRRELKRAAAPLKSRQASKIAKAAKPPRPKPKRLKKRASAKATAGPRTLVTYDRVAALAYARKFWTLPVSDLFIAGTFGANPFRTVPAGTKFIHRNTPPEEQAILPNGEPPIDVDVIDDCTHYISGCIGQPPGGGGGTLPVPRDFPSGPYGIISATRLVDTLVARKWATVQKFKDVASVPVAEIVAGDLIGYFSNAKGRYIHLAMHVGNQRIACHTICRSDLPECTWNPEGWKLFVTDPDIDYALIKFVV